MGVDGIVLTILVSGVGLGLMDLLLIPFRRRLAGRRLPERSSAYIGRINNLSAAAPCVGVVPPVGSGVLPQLSPRGSVTRGFWGVRRPLGRLYNG